MYVQSNLVFNSYIKYELNWIKKFTEKQDFHLHPSDNDPKLGQDHCNLYKWIKLLLQKIWKLSLE